MYLTIDIFILQVVEHIYHCKEESLSMKDIYEDMINKTLHVLTFSNWNLLQAISKYVSFTFTCQGEKSVPKILSPTLEDKYYIDLLMALLHDLSHMELYDWRTKSIGTWIAKSHWMVKSYCRQINMTEFDEKIN